MTLKKLAKIIKAARGEIPADLVLKGAKVVNVFSCQVQETDVAVSEGTIVGLGSFAGRELLDCRDRFIAPGFIDGHLHIESTLLTPSRLAPVLLPLGTTTVVADPHEVANVCGLDGIEFLLRDSNRIELEVYFMAPSCVPATDLETAGALLEEKDLLRLRRLPRVLGLAEMMNFPGVIHRSPPVLTKLLAFRDRVIDGHAPLLSGRDLGAYLAAGPGSDHECTQLEEAREKLALGMRIMIREGSQAKNLQDLLPLINSCNARRCSLVTDDRHPDDLAGEGHLNHVLKKAVGLGLDPLLAVQMVTLNTAEYFGLRRLGAVAPGYQADLVILKSLAGMEVEAVIKRGRLVAREGHHTGEPIYPQAGRLDSSMHIKDLSVDRFRLASPGGFARVIELVPGQILTRDQRQRIEVRDGRVLFPPPEDLALLACVERHRGTGNIGLGLVRGFGLKRGALASSVAHDSHNILVLGREPEEMAAAVRAVEAMKGGLAVVMHEKAVAQFPLPIAGIMSDQPLDQVLELKKKLLEAVPLTGCTLADPFMALSFLALPVIPELRLTDRGLVDVGRQEIIALFE
jgi:adenine deaminase